jgi:hypothetical protein
MQIVTRCFNEDRRHVQKTGRCGVRRGSNFIRSLKREAHGRARAFSRALTSALVAETFSADDRDGLLPSFMPTTGYDIS